MLTIRTAAALLQAADSAGPLAALLASVGITGTPRPLDAARRQAIGATEQTRDLQVVAGPGTVRALIVCVRDGPPLREQLARLAARLQSRAPHVLWLLAAADARDGTVALAAWNADHRPPRVRTLVVSRSRVVDSDAETVCALAASACADDVLLHLRWTEVLGRDALGRRFYREVEQRVSALAGSASCTAVPEERRALALLHTSRLLFLAFLEAKGWLDGRPHFLSELYDARMTRGGAFHRRALRPLFFGTLNTPCVRRAAVARAFGRIPFLNGGLFAPTPLERRHRDLYFGDAEQGALLGDLFAHYRFTAREDATSWSDAAIDPEMLGRTFESLMAAGDRRDSGAFFTPQHLVERVTDLALVQLLRDAGLSPRAARRLLTDGVTPDSDGPALLRHLGRVTLLDPACGSGAFLVHALQRLAALRAQLGDARSVSDIRRDALMRSVFGVDRNPTAVWLCELRLWLSVVIECDRDDPMTVAPLPNLDRNVRVGDALSGAAFDVDAAALGRSAELATLRRRYARASGTRKATLGRALDHGERARALLLLDRGIAGVQHARRECVMAGRGRDLFGERRGVSAADRETLATLRARAASLRRERRRLADGGALPFSFAVHFADVAAAGGFDAVVGNPPWVRLHHIAAGERAMLRRTYTVFRRAPWAAGAAAAHAGPGFASQADLSALFVERGAALLRPGGTLALLVPAKLWRSLAGGGVRHLLRRGMQLTRVEDLSDAPAVFDAAVYPSIVAARAPGGHAALERQTAFAVQRGAAVVRWRTPSAAIALDDTPGSPWLFLPPPARSAFDRLTAAGMPILETPVGRPMLGVKCGCNDAFVVEVMDSRGGVACIRAAGGRTGEVESAMLRPAVRGESLHPWRVTPNAECVIWPHDARGTPLTTLPPRTMRWLSRYKRRLLARSDARGGPAWWSVFRTEGAACDAPRVAWADFGRRPRALVLPSGNRAVPLNTCYVARCMDLDDARTLAAILNSVVAAAWLHALAGIERRRLLASGPKRHPLGESIALRERRCYTEFRNSGFDRSIYRVKPPSPSAHTCHTKSIFCRSGQLARVATPLPCDMAI